MTSIINLNKRIGTTEYIKLQLALTSLDVFLGFRDFIRKVYIAKAFYISDFIKICIKQGLHFSHPKLNALPKRAYMSSE